MLLRRFLSFLVALAIMLIAGVLVSAPALAHKGHAHTVEFSAASSTLEVMLETLQVAETPVEFANFAEHAQDAVAFGAADGPENEGKTPCDGHCCPVAGSSCCGFMAHSSSQWMTCASSREMGSLPAGDSDRDSLFPDSLLRPPQTQA